MRRQRWPDDRHIRLEIRQLPPSSELSIPVGPDGGMLSLPVSTLHLFGLTAQEFDLVATDIEREIKHALFVNAPMQFKPDTSRSFRLARWLGWKRIHAA